MDTIALSVVQRRRCLPPTLHYGLVFDFTMAALKNEARLEGKSFHLMVYRKFLVYPSGLRLSKNINPNQHHATAPKKSTHKTCRSYFAVSTQAVQLNSNCCPTDT